MSDFAVLARASAAEGFSAFVTLSKGICDRGSNLGPYCSFCRHPTPPPTQTTAHIIAKIADTDRVAPGERTTVGPGPGEAHAQGRRPLPPGAARCQGLRRLSGDSIPPMPGAAGSEAQSWRKQRAGLPTLGHSWLQQRQPRPRLRPRAGHAALRRDGGRAMRTKAQAAASASQRLFAGSLTDHEGSVRGHCAIVASCTRVTVGAWP